MRWPMMVPLAALLAVLVVSPVFAANPPKVVRLANGLTVMTIEDNRFPLVAVRLFVHAGSGYETARQAGLSHLLEHMVFKSTQKRQAGQVASDIEGAGGELNASTSFDSTVFRVDLPADRWKLGLDAISDMIFGARFVPGELDAERQVVLSELARGKDSPDNRLFQLTQAMAWPGLAYGWPIIGFPETVSAFTSEDLRGYVKERYQPQSMLLVVVGKIQAEAVEKEAQALFGGLQNDRPLTPPLPYAQPVGAAAGPAVKVEYGQWNKVRLQVAFPTAGLRGADEAGLEVLSGLLAGDETSRLYRTFKYDKKLVDDISCSSLTLERGGLFLIDATLDARNVAAFWQGLLSELARLRGTAFTDHEIERVKLNLEDGLYQAKETLSGLAMKAGYFRFYGYDPDGEANYLRSVRLVDQKALGAIIEATLRPERMLTAAIAPQADEATVTAKELGDMAARIWPAPKADARSAEKGPEAASGEVAAPEVVDLGGGHTLVFLPDRTLPYVSVSMVFNGGDALLAKDRQGLAELAAGSLTSGTAKLSANAIEDFLSDRAASLSASSGRDSFSVGAKFPNRFQQDLYGLIADVLQHPAFLKTEVDRQVQDQLAAIKAKEEQPMGLAFRKLFPFLFTDTPYAYTRLGEPATVKAFTPKDVAGYWAAQRTMPWVMAVCGDFDAAAVRHLADTLAKATGPAKPFAFPTPTWGEKREQAVTLAERKQTHLLMVFPVPGLTSPDTPGLELLNDVLAGQSGLLFSQLREGESLGYSVTSFLWQAEHTGFMAFYIGTSPDKADAALDGFRRVAGQLRDTPLPDDLMRRGKNVMSGDYYRERQGLKARSGEAAQSLALGLPLDHDRRVVEAAQALTPENLQELAGKYLKPEAAYVMKVEP
ncbi:processing peptidase [Solidesulfovibrio carbinoliphilus subsp. oakridgensis]|uniref:Processing peptidase n=1 Tax=Solidesulfovibrio carbinoliphilus subsp. oakridgensis TaxID=694327 RepID=G7Q4A5_9BACT|nr:pitrilysin family protein [Solidesulfovibrio carbinoliphilus]EHJ46973.1 processing peptidase [Solidesulfovibrio carbinoliphilus subsp. oakridgensis]